jgi:hypothetical protein
VGALAVGGIVAGVVGDLHLLLAIPEFVLLV